MKLIFKRKKRGLTLIETLLALGVAAIVIIGAVSFYNNAAGTNAINDAKGQIQAYVNGVKKVYASQSTYTGLDNATIIATGVAPQPAISGANGLVNPWRGTTTIASASGGSAFTVTMAGVPQDACVSLLTSGLLSGGGVYQIGSGGGSFTAEPSVSQALTACNQTNDSMGNNVIVTAR